MIGPIRPLLLPRVFAKRLPIRGMIGNGGGDRSQHPHTLRLRPFVFNDLRRQGKTGLLNDSYSPLSPTTVSFVAQIARRQFMLLRSSRSSGEKWLYRPVSISLSRANGGISRKALIALCTSWRTGGFCRGGGGGPWWGSGPGVSRPVGENGHA